MKTILANTVTTNPIHSPSRTLGGRIACAVLLSLAGVALGQGEPDASAGKQRGAALEEVLVTAQRREESIRDVPISMQAFTGETLRKLGIVDTRDLASIVPGFSYADSGYDNPIYTLRGVGFNDYSRTANATVGVYIDEAPITYPYMTQGADVDIKRIEVLKGPQGTLYGRNTTGGAINYIAEKPTDSLELGVEAEYGRFETYSVEGYVSGGFTDRLRGRLALRHIQADEGWQISLTRPEDRLGKEDKQAARAALEWDPIDPLRLNVTVDWWRDRSEPQAPQPIAIRIQNTQCREQSEELGTSGDECLHPDVRDHPLVESEDPRLADWPPDTRWQLNNEFVMPALRAYWTVTDRLSLTLIAAYTDFVTDDANFPQSGLSVHNVEQVGRSTDTEAHSIELRAEGNHLDERLQWIVGLYRSEDTVFDVQRVRVDTQSAVFNTVPGVTPIIKFNTFDGEQEAESDAVFANLDYVLTSYLTLSLGARFTDEVRRFAGCSREDPSNPEGTGLAPIFNARSLSEGGSGGAEEGECLTLDEETRNPSRIRKKLEEDNLGGKFAINWRPADNHLFYASYSRGFKSGSFPIIPAAEGKQFEPVTQERVDSLEIGGKTSWFGDALRVDFAVFDYEYTDKQVFSIFVDPVFGPLPKLFNAPESEIRGAELEIQASPLPGLFISAAASYLDTEIVEFIGVNRDGNEEDFSGNELPFAPKTELTVVANYSFPLPFLTTLEGTVGADYSYVGETTSDIGDESIRDLPSYELVNARLGVGDIDGRWDVTAWVRNATNEFYQLSVPELPKDTITRFTGMPQTVGLTVSYRYY